MKTLVLPSLACIVGCLVLGWITWVPLNAQGPRESLDDRVVIRTIKVGETTDENGDPMAIELTVTITNTPITADEQTVGDTCPTCGTYTWPEGDPIIIED